MGQLQLAFIERWPYYRGRLQCSSTVSVLFGSREAGCFRKVAALHSDHLRQFPMYVHLFRAFPATISGRRVLKYYTVTIQHGLCMSKQSECNRLPLWER